jgi:hypothetical protein
VSAKGLLGCLLLAALHALIVLTPALAAGAEQACTTRPLVQGSGNVRICEVRR